MEGITDIRVLVIARFDFPSLFPGNVSLSLLQDLLKKKKGREKTSKRASQGQDISLLLFCLEDYSFSLASLILFILVIQFSPIIQYKCVRM